MIFWDPSIGGSIQDHSTWRDGIIHQVAWDPGINAQMLLLWVEVDHLRTRNIWAGEFVIFPFLIWSKWTKTIHGIIMVFSHGIDPWYC